MVQVPHHLASVQFIAVFGCSNLSAIMLPKETICCHTQPQNGAKRIGQLVPNFFVEFRFHGYAKRQLKGLIHEVARQFRVRGATKYRPVPHMALFYGGPGTVDIRKVCDAVEKAAKNYSLVPFKVDGFEWHDGEEGKVIAAAIKASPELRQLREALADELSNTCSLHRFDAQPDFWFHTTIAFKDIDQKFDRIWHYLSRKEKPYVNQHLIRITVLNRERKIEREYDLLFKRWLNRREALDNGLYRKTVNRLAELTGEPLEVKVSLWHRIVEYVQHLRGKKSLYLIGDTHFDHGNIIKYVNRPFRNTEEMNKTLVTMWNALVAPRDTVYFLGDWSFGRGSRPPKYWVNRLRGHIKTIKGSHDTSDDKDINMLEFDELHYKGYRFLLIHNPDPHDPRQTENQKQKLVNWHGWIIHGHKHNNDLKDYPFINGERKTINVSVELLRYQPLNIDKLLSLDIDSIRRMETISSQAERW